MTGDGAVAAVLLAAGESRRMGAINKLALPFGGVPLVRRAALTLLEARLAENRAQAPTAWRL
jgi:molybdenum cofactor cytidylyltransferase